MMNDYYQGLIADNNIQLAIQDLQDRDGEIESLKNEIKDLKTQLENVQKMVNAESIGSFVVTENPQA
jgi:archaellum component FlaC